MGNLGRIRCYAGDIKPEADPGNLKLQLLGIFFKHIFPGISGSQISTVNQTTGLVVDQRPQIGDFTGLGGHCRCKTGHHFAVYHLAHQVAQILRGLAGQHIISGDMNKINIRMQGCRFAGTVFHVVGSGEDQLGTFFHHIVNQLGNGYPRTIGRINLVYIDHLGARHHFLDIFACLKMSLTPAVVVVRPDQKQSKNIGFFIGRYRTACRNQETKNKTEGCETVNRFFHHRISSLIVWNEKSISYLAG